MITRGSKLATAVPFGSRSHSRVEKDAVFAVVAPFILPAVQPSSAWNVSVGTNFESRIKNLSLQEDFVYGFMLICELNSTVPKLYKILLPRAADINNLNAVLESYDAGFT